jgi:hypothetical protein
LLAIQNDPTALEARLNAVAADEVDAPTGVPAAELADQPIAILRRIGAAHSGRVSTALDVTSVRDLALWPPYATGQAMLDMAYYSTGWCCLRCVSWYSPCSVNREHRL